MLLFICSLSSSEEPEYYSSEDRYELIREFYRPFPWQEEGDLTEYKKWAEQAKKNPPFLVLPSTMSRVRETDEAKRSDHPTGD